LLTHSQVVLNVLHTRDIVHNVLGPPLGLPIFHGSVQGDFAVLHADIDFRCIDKRVIGEPIVDIIPNPLVGTGISLGAMPPVLSGTSLILAASALGITVTEPRADLVARSIPETPLLAATAAIILTAGRTAIVTTAAIFARTVIALAIVLTA
jgi:hypothetical protein